MNVYLVGFMGCGKSVVGRALADRLGLEFLDLDVRLEDQFGMTIADYFVRYGEDEFRRKETEALEQVSLSSGLVVATGGGAFCESGNRRIMKRAEDVSVFLDVPWETIETRLAGPNDDRPKWQDAESARKLFMKRQRWYRQAMIRVKVSSSMSPVEVAREIERALQGRV